MPSGCNLTDVARAMADPTDAVHANRTFPSDNGCCLSSSDNAKSAHCCAGIMLRSYHRLVGIVLASRSPRRSTLLRDAGYDIEESPADVEEHQLSDESPRTYVSRLAVDKATVVAQRYPDQIVIGADTVVVVNDVVFGKPLDRTDAIGMLTKLSGRTHTVLTGVVVMRASTVFTGVESTEVTFVDLSSERIAWYVSTGESDDKAGAYAAQGVGSRLIERVNGSYTNVVGLPMALVDRFVRKFDRNI